MSSNLGAKPLTLAALALSACSVAGLAGHARTTPARRARQQPPPPSAQPAELARGVELYRRGDMGGASKALRAAVKKQSKGDARAWLYLGQALMWRGELGDARKALDSALRLDPNFAAARAAFAFLHMNAGRMREAEAEAARALELDPNEVDAHYVVGVIRLREGAWLRAVEKADAIIKINDRAALAYALKSEALLGLHEHGRAIIADERRGAYDYDSATVEHALAAQPSRLRQAAESLGKYLSLAPQAPDAAEKRAQMEAMLAYAEADPARRIYSTSAVTSRAVIKFKPEPGYTEEARRAGVRGVVRLRAVLAADGTVKHVLVLRRLSYGLTEKAVAAARKIKFEPATVAGTPVSQHVILEYNFNIY
jgi:TonB family protein